MQFTTILKNNTIKIPEKILKDFEFEDGHYYPFEINEVGNSGKLRLILRCSSGCELYFPKTVAAQYQGKKIKIREFNRAIHHSNIPS